MGAGGLMLRMTPIPGSLAFPHAENTGLSARF